MDIFFPCNTIHPVFPIISGGSQSPIGHIYQQFHLSAHFRLGIIDTHHPGFFLFKVNPFCHYFPSYFHQVILNTFLVQHNGQPINCIPFGDGIKIEINIRVLLNDPILG